MSKLPPFLELGGRMYGVRLPEGARLKLPEEEKKQLFLDTIVLDTIVLDTDGPVLDTIGPFVDRNMIVYRYYTTDPEVFLTSNKEDAIPITTERHSARRCPYCGSDKCMRNSVGETVIDYFCEQRTEIPSGRRVIFAVHQCNDSQFFINQEFRTRKTNKEICEYCGSPNLNILHTGTARPSINGQITDPKSPHFFPPLVLNYQEQKFEMTDQIQGGIDPIDKDPEDRIVRLTGIRYRCQNCDFESTLWVIRTLKKSFVNYHQHLISHRDNLEACLGKSKGNEKSTWILRVTPGWEVVEQ